jgi:hypothetical protein
LDHGLPTRSRPLRELSERGPSEHRQWVPKPRPSGTAEDTLKCLVRSQFGTGNHEALRMLAVVGVGSDDLLTLLPRYTKLEELSVKSAHINARGLWALAALRHLRTLVLHDLTLDAEALRAIATFPALEYLTLADVTFKGEAIGELGAAQTLALLRVVNCEVSAHGLRGLCRCRALSCLDLEDVKLDQEQLDALATCQGLRELCVTQGLFASLDITRLRKALPSLHVKLS